MPLRDLAITLFVFGAIPYMLKHPYMGVLVWSWLGYMNPHRLCWGFAYDLPFAQVTALVLFVSLLKSQEPKEIPVTGTTLVWLLFLFWMLLTTVFGFNTVESYYYFLLVLKIQAVILITLMVMGTKERINQLVWVIVISIGYYGVKGGIFTLRSGGGHRVWGPPQSFIEDNNALALALLMILPLMYYLWIITDRDWTFRGYVIRYKWIRWGLLLSMFLTAAASIGSYSRGAFLASFCMAFFLWLKSSQKALLGAILVLLIPLMIAFMPEQWHARMNTITTYEEDNSALGRLQAWKMSINLANSRLLGGGFVAPWSQPVFNVYGEGAPARAAHSIYFTVLAEHGWIGLFLFLLVLLLTWRTGSWIIRHSRGQAELKWVADLAKMTQVSIVAYGVGGAFLSLSYYDLPWHLMALMVLGKQIVQRHLTQARQATLKRQPGLRPSAPAFPVARPIGGRMLRKF